MSSYRYRILPLYLLLFIFISKNLFAGTTGKIAGRIMDRETGEPLPGVNVIVKETTLGSTTDIDGYYAVLQVPPGVHSVVASMVGYATVTINDVNVNIDQTATVNINMTSEAIEIGDITVVAERSLVKQDVSTSVASVRPDEIEVLPVTSITDIVGLQAGIDEGLVIRGGQADELLFQIDGVTLRDPRNNQPISSVALSSIQEVSIERGGFNAEYGQVRSGIVNIVGKEGSANNYFGSAQIKYSPATPKYFGISVFDPNSMWNRPYLDPAVCWTGTESGAWNLYQRRQYPRFDGWNAISQQLLTDDNPNNDLSPAAAQKVWMWERRRRPVIEPDYNIDASFGGPVPFISKDLGNLRFFASYRFEKEMLLIPLSRPDYQEFTGSIKINSNITRDMSLMLNASTGKSYNVVMNADDRQFNDPAWGINAIQFWSPTAFMRTPYKIAEITNEQRASRIFTDSWYSQAEVGNFSLAGKLTDFITSSTFYELGFEYVDRKYKTGPIRHRDLTRKYEIVPGFFVDEGPFGFDVNPIDPNGIAETGFFFGGHSSTIRDSSNNASYVLKGDLTSQVTPEHLVKAGFEFSYYDLKINYGVVNVFFDTYNYVKERRFPYRLAAYVQDKIEALGFIANLGVRMDMSNPNTEWPDVDQFDQNFFSGLEDLSQVPMKKANVDIAFSPRIGISHPITENSKLYFNYGHFKQLPSYDEIFRMGYSSNGKLINYGNPNLELAKTISYELGYDHVLFEQYLLQLAAFYNDVTNQQAYSQYISGNDVAYFAPNNDSYEDIRGLEITFKKTEGNWIRGFINYTYQINTQGAFGRAIINADPIEQKILDRNTATLYQQKPVPQPRARASITFISPGDLGPDFGGLKPLSDWSLNVLAFWRAGEYITYNPAQVREIVNNVQVTDYFNIDLRLNKTFDFDFLDFTLFIDVRNLLNTKRLSGASFYDAYDQLYYFQSLHLPSSRAYDNIPGDDRAGEYRKEDVQYQPIETRGVIDPATQTGDAGVIYWERASGKYMEYKDGAWSDVESSRMQKILDDKAYIDMPNNSSFNFLNPRQLFFGINLSFKL